MKKNYVLARIAALCVLVAFTLALGACSSTQTVGEQVDDAGITSRVKAKLAADGDINPFNIDVDTVDGVVTLTGKVAEAQARSKAEQLARDTDGVKRVNNLITVGDSSR
jgi:hyperosmotically inducible protein